jgi:hypothetical protein
VESDRFEENVPLPPIDVPDWDLARRVERLLAPHVLRSAPLRMEATDIRGTYERESVASLIETADARDERPHRVRLYISGSEGEAHGSRFLDVIQGREHSSARFISADEQLVNHLGARVRALYSEAKRLPEARAAPIVSADGQGKWKGAAAALWDKKGIVTGLVVALLVTLGSAGHRVISSNWPFHSSHPPTLVQETIWSPIGAPTFTDYRQQLGPGRRLQLGETVNVSCRVKEAFIHSARGGWYRIASPPWNDHYWAAANTFLNGDPVNGPFTHPSDPQVPIC